MKKIIVWAVLAFSGITTAWPANFSDEPRQDVWVTDDTVRAIAQHGNIAYIGGYFTRVGPNTGSIAPIDADTGLAADDFPRVNGVVYASISDGSGGWFIGGDFTEVGGLARNNLAHIGTDGSTSDWNPSANLAVRALALSSDGETVYVGGDFTDINGEIRNCIAALDAATGAVEDWNPSANNPVHALALSPDDAVLYAGGNFTVIGGESRNRVAGLDAETGVATIWNPSANSYVYTLTLSPDGGTVYAGGAFTFIGGIARDRIAALNNINGTATAWNPGANGVVYALDVSPDGGTIYAGGSFTIIGLGTVRYCIAALNGVTGAATAWNPHASGSVRTLAVTPDGATVYAGGSFRAIGAGVDRSCSFIVALNAADAHVTTWKPVLNANVLTLCLAPDTSVVLAGGSFSCATWYSRNRIAAIDLSTGAPTAWDPDADYDVHALAVSPDGGTIYAGGDFSSIGGESRNRIAELDAGTGLATSWNPDADSVVYTLVMAPDGATVYAGGIFSSMSGEPRNNIAELDAGTGIPTDWNPNANSDIYALAVAPDGTTIYAGGHFSSIGMESRNRIAALDATLGLASSWNPSSNGDVYALTVSPDGDTVYAGGAFTRMNIIAEDRKYIAALDAATGIPTSWSPELDDNVYALAMAPDGGTVYVGGRFEDISGQSRGRIAALDSVTGLPSSWLASADNMTVRSLALSVDGQILCVGGDFSSMRIPCYGLAAFSPQYTLTYAAGANGSISGMATQTVYHGCNGTQVTAVPATGYHFTQWSDDSTSNPRQDLSVTGNIAVTAAFVLSLNPPDIPSNVAASAGNILNQVQLSWDTAARATSYEVRRGIQSDGSDSVKLTDTAVPSYTDTNVSANVNYYYRIRAENAAGSSAFSTATPGFPGVPGPMIMANGLVGDHIMLNRNATLALSVRLHKHTYPSVMVDWWAAAHAQNSDAWFYLDNTLNWVPFDGNLSNCHPAAIMPLTDLAPHVIGSWSGLAPGVYNAWFAVDYPGDGILHLISGQYLLSRVTITVE